MKLKTLKKIALKYRMELIILYGSIAKGTQRRQSDIDIGIYLFKNPSEKLEMAILEDMVNLFKTDALDLAILNYASPLLNYKVVTEGRLLYEKKTGDFLRFKLKAIKDYWNTNKFRTAREEFLDKVAAGR